MNRLLLATCVITLAFSLNAQKPSVVASASLFADMVKELSGDLFDVQMIVPVGSDPHIYEPTPRDAKKVAGADLVLINGLTFEGWIKELAENSGLIGEIVTITKGISERTSDKYHNSADPHAWMDANNVLTYIENIKTELIKLLPNSYDKIEANYEIYCNKLKELDSYIMDRIREIPKPQRVLVTSHDAFAYYGARYGIQVEALMGISTESDARTSDISRVKNRIVTSGVPAVFIESTINPKLLEQLAKDTGVRIGGELYADSLGEDGGEADTYLKMMKKNTDKIVNALTEKEIIDLEKTSSSIWLYIVLGGILLLGLFVMIFAMKK